MAIMDIVKEGDSILHQLCEGVDLNVEKEAISHLVINMVDTVKNANGVGLAAPQVGISKRVIVVKDIDKNIFFEMINPEIYWTSFDKCDDYEGCLSVVDEQGEYIHEKIERYKRIRVKWEDLKGGLHDELIKNNLQARIIQHEIDHLNGVLFTDYLK